MIRRIALALLMCLACGPLRAELTLFFVEADEKETPVGNRIVTPETAAGDFTDVRLRVRNTGPANDFVNSFLVRGAGFSLLTVPSLPFLITPGLNLDVRLRFQPNGPGSYSGTLLLNGASLLVMGKSPDTASLWVDQAGWRLVSNSEEIDFGRIQSNTSVSLAFAFRNETSQPVKVSSMLLAPGAFELIQPPPLPVEIAPGGELNFSVRFAPLRGGVFRSALTVDGRSLRFAGNAFEPPLPEPLLSFVSPDFSSARQQTLNVRFAEPARGNGIMRLTLAFTPRQGSPDDPAIMFIANSSRTLSFDVRAGQEALAWNGDPNLIFQTGTTAGLIRFTVAFDSSARSIEFPVATAAPHLESARIARTTSSIALTLAGYDNARSFTTLAFTFYHRDGSVIGGGPLVSQVGTLFANYFRNFLAGGGFSAQIVFPVSGSPENVVGLEIEASNSAGSTRTQRVSF